MDEILFKAWLIETGINNKVASDTISRLKRLERELGYQDLDTLFEKDKCSNVLELMKKKNAEKLEEAYPNIKLPVGKYSMNTYRLALNRYISYRTSNDQ